MNENNSTHWDATNNTPWKESCRRVIQSAIDYANHQRAHQLPVVWVSTENYAEILAAGSIEEWLLQKYEREAQERHQTLVMVRQRTDKEPDWPSFSARSQGNNR